MFDAAAWERKNEVCMQIKGNVMYTYFEIIHASQHNQDVVHLFALSVVAPSFIEAV